MRMKNVRPVRSRSGLRHAESGYINVVAFSHDGRLLATAGDSGQICLWNTRDWTAAVIIDQPGDIQRMLFSPDDRFLYAVGGAPTWQVHARFDTRSGKLDKTYHGHRQEVCWMELSPDGRTMVTSTYFEHVMHFWDTESGAILRTIQASDEECRFLLTPDGKGILRPVSSKVPVGAAGQRVGSRWRRTAPDWFVEPFRGDRAVNVSAPRAWEETTPVSSSADPGLVYWSVEGGRVAWGRWEKDGLHPLGDKVVEPRTSGRLAVAPNGKFLAYAGSDNIVRCYSLPELRLVGTVVLPPPDGYRFKTFDEAATLSPDGKLLAAGVVAPTPALIQTDSFKQIQPYDGHAGAVEEVFFAGDGKRLRSYGSDNIVCTWDASTMKMLSRVEIPLRYCWSSIRPTDGRYAICFSAAAKGRLPDESSDTSDEPARVFDAERGQFVATLPIKDSTVHWIDGHEIAVLERNSEGKDVVRRFNYLSGKIVSTINSGHTDFAGELAEDGCSVFSFRGGPGTHLASPCVLDIITGKVMEDDFRNGESVRASMAGLVPDGKHFYLANPHIYVYDRKTSKQVAKKLLDGVEILSLSFSQNGSRYALACRDQLKWYEPRSRSIVRIHDTLSGRTLLALAASTRWARVKLSRDGKRLTVINDDGTIEVWTLPM